MKQFTDGEWLIDDDSDIICGRHLIAMTSNSVGFSERYANARLIQAAPEMYELLSNLSDIAEYNPNLKRLAKQAENLIERIDTRY